MKSKQLTGSLAGMISAACYGCSPALALGLYALHYDAANALFYRYFAAMVLMAVILLIKREKFTLPWKDIKVLAIPGLFFALSTLAYFISFSYMNAGISATILFLYPIFTALIMALAYHERIKKSIAAAIVLSFMGVFLLHGAEAGGLSPIGTALAVASAVTYALYIVGINRSHLFISNDKLTFYLIIFSVLLTAVFMVVSPTSSLQLPSSWEAWGLIALLGIVPTIISLELMNVAVVNIGSTATAILGALEPVTAVALSVIIFHDQITMSLLLGIGLILLGVLLVIVGNSFKPKRIRVYVRYLGQRMQKEVHRHWRWKS